MEIKVEIKDTRIYPHTSVFNGYKEKMTDTKLLVLDAIVGSTEGYTLVKILEGGNKKIHTRTILEYVEILKINSLSKMKRGEKTKRIEYILEKIRESTQRKIS